MFFFIKHKHKRLKDFWNKKFSVGVNGLSYVWWSQDKRHVFGWELIWRDQKDSKTNFSDGTLSLQPLTSLRWKSHFDGFNFNQMKNHWYHNSTCGIRGNSQFTKEPNRSSSCINMDGHDFNGWIFNAETTSCRNS